MKFTFHIPTEIRFGKGVAKGIGIAVSPYGKKALLVYGGNSIKKNGIYDDVTKSLMDAGIEWLELPGVQPNPKASLCQKGIEICRENNIDFVVAVGGGSSSDCAKGVCAGYYYDGTLREMIEKHVPAKKALPLFVVITLAATGSEMNDGGVITIDETNTKASVHGPAIYPTISFLDPSYTYTVPARQTAAGTADIFTHVIENYFDSATDTYFTDGVCESILRTCVKYGPIAIAEPENDEARSNLLLASSWAMSGLVMGGRNEGPTLHPLQAPIGGWYDNTHGEGLAILMPNWFRKILSGSTVGKFAQFGINVFGIDKDLDKYEIANKAIEDTEDFFFNKLGVPRTLGEIGVDDKHLDEMADAALQRLAHAYVSLSKDDIIDLYKSAL